MEKYACDCCEYSTDRKPNLNRHLLSNKHLKNSALINNEHVTQKNKPKKVLMCKYCEKICDGKDKKYRHQKMCTQSPNNNKILTLEEIISNMQNKLEHKNNLLKKNGIYDCGDDASNKVQKKKTIPKILKNKIWNKHIGIKIGQTKCLCCKFVYISQMNFQCGHIISEKDGGAMSVNNLKPICGPCNSSMGTMNMNEFIDKCNF